MKSFEKDGPSIASTTAPRRPRPTKGADMSTSKTTRAPMSTTRKLALGAGLFYIATFVFSIPTLAMTDSFINNPNFIHGAGSDAGVQWAALFDMLTGLT